MNAHLETISELRARIAAHDAWIDSIRDKRSGWASYRPEDKPANVPDVSNDDRSALEVYNWLTRTAPTSYFLYINEESRTATTWTGDVLGHVEFFPSYRDNFGGVRVPIRLRGINGRRYFGTYYKSAGNYARVKLAKE